MSEYPKIVRTEEEILDVIEDAYLWKSTGRFRGMTFEEGMDAMYQWLIGEEEKPPLPPFERK